MDNDIITFNKEGFGEIRTLAINNEPWFIGKDVATALGYGGDNNDSKALQNAVRKHVYDDDKKLMTYEEFKGHQNGDLKNISKYGMMLINESGLYSLILSSKLPKAKEFKHWVTSEVLPAIRKTGNYHQPKGKELLALALVEANTMLTNLEKENQDLKIDIAHKTEKIVDLTPKAIFADRIVDSKGTISVRDLALILTDNGYKISSPELFRWLREKGYIYKKSPKAKQKYISDGLFKLRTSVTPDGYNIFSSTRVTGKGMKYFLEKFLPNKTEYKYTVEVK